MFLNPHHHAGSTLARRPFVLCHPLGDISPRVSILRIWLPYQTGRRATSRTGHLGRRV
ncbi:Uncharacterised protein [Vibrio cholerae]|nr:Uncharacterised protein [Vibrio cholerae]